MAARKKSTAGTKKTKKKAAGKKSTASKKAASKASTASKGGSVASAEVNLGHVHALRPRVNVSFKQAEFLNAKRELAEESFASIEEAARAVAEKALEATNRKPGKHSIGR